jgi:formamidopyrimidine-DNA glycosylase
VPELPDITVYLEALQTRVLGQTLARVRIASPFLLRTAAPPIQTLAGQKVIVLRRMGKRLVFGFENDLWLVLHLMIAGRLHWLPAATASGQAAAAAVPRPGSNRKSVGKQWLAAFTFAGGTLTLTEAGTTRRASLHLLHGEAALRALDPGGLETLGCTAAQFAATLTRRNHTLKRALTDPRLFSGIGNAYSDEILHRARLSPVALTQKLPGEQIERLHRATVELLGDWVERLRRQAGGAFPEKVTAFRPDMAVHGKFGRPCPVCGAKVQRIRYAANETNYCPHCQTGGKLLADRSLSLLLKRDWPKTPEELEELRAGKLASKAPAPRQNET